MSFHLETKDYSKVLNLNEITSSREMKVLKPKEQSFIILTSPSFLSLATAAVSNLFESFSSSVVLEFLALYKLRRHVNYLQYEKTAVVSNVISKENKD